MKFLILTVMSFLFMNLPSIKSFSTLQNGTEENSFCLTVIIQHSSFQNSDIETTLNLLKALYTKHTEKIKIIKPFKILKGEMDVPYQIQFLTFSSLHAFDEMRHSREYKSLLNLLQNEYGVKIDFIISQNVETDLMLEEGSTTKIYAITLLTLKEGEKYKRIFEDYLKRACAIMPEFGVHFEKMLLPIEQKGMVDNLDRVHLFFFDCPDGIDQMVNDKRMQNLFPLRDQSVLNASLILGSQIN